MAADQSEANLTLAMMAKAEAWDMLMAALDSMAAGNSGLVAQRFGVILRKRAAEALEISTEGLAEVLRELSTKKEPEHG